MILQSLLTIALLATTAFAAPSGELLPCIPRGRRSKPNQRVQISSRANNPDVQYSDNWAGIVLNYPSGSFYNITGTFTVPTPSSPEGSASAWVGIDGDSCQNAILQTGIDFYYQSGSVSYDAWYEWYPDFSYNFNGISINSGDVIQLNVTVFSTTSGNALIKNLSNGQQVSQNLTSSSALCQQDAEWIVEDFESGGSLVPLCNFGTVTWTDAVAYLTGGGIVTPDQSGIGNVLGIEQNGRVYSSVSEGSSGITISYV